MEPLTDSGRRLMQWYFMDGLNLKQIGIKLGVTESRASQLISQCKKEIRKSWKDREYELHEEVGGRALAI